jgi:hypothetical protein
VPADECVAAGGAGLGDGTPCDDAACPVYGACCFTDGSCTSVPADECVAAGGAAQGDGAACADVSCLVSGACCFTDGSCTFEPGADCVSAGGTALGDGTTCADAACPVSGACCFTDGSCTFEPEADCVAAGGVAQGDGVTCGAVECPPYGASCFTDGRCEFLTEAQCLESGGFYQGDGVDCAVASCPPYGACCFTDGSCTFEPADSCAISGGVPQGDGAGCEDDATCPIYGGCCFPDGGCTVLAEPDCAAQGGLHQGTDGACAPNPCPQPQVIDHYRGTCTEKGSVLFFSKVEIRWNTLGTDLLQDTFLSLTNDYVSDVQVQMYFINGDPPLEADPATGERAHLGWNWVDNQITLTANEPTYWSALTGNPKGVSPFTSLDPGPAGSPGRPAVDGTDDRVLRGYVVAWAVNPATEEIRWNHLTGAGTVINYAGGWAWEYNACAYSAVEPGLANGDVTGSPGVLNFDGVEFSQAFSELVLNFQAATSDAFGNPAAGVNFISDTDLTLHPVSADLRQNSDGPVTTKASMDIWNENEVKFSGTHRCVTCWDQTLISRYDPPNHFDKAFLQTDHGKAQIDGHAATVCNVLDDPDTPEDESVTSVNAAVLGVAARLLRANGMRAAAGSNLLGMGFENATIEFDTGGEPPEAGEPDGGTALLDWLEELAGISSRPGRDDR